MDDDLAFSLRQLVSSDARARVRTLQVIATEPVADRDLLVACERLLDDREVCLVSIPYRFGEVRVAAASAVAAIRAALGIVQPVVLPDAFAPLTPDAIGQLAAAADISVGGGVEGSIAALRALVALGRVPTRHMAR